MRVISGTARGRKLLAPPGRGTRPITDRAKEGVFNMLESLGGMSDASVVDLFAGSGSFGIEALSRGAEHVTFVEKHPAAAAVINRNLETLGFTDRAEVRIGAVERHLSALPNVDIAFCDPPYADDPWIDLLNELSADLMMGHANDPVVLTERWEEIRRRTYGKAHIVIARATDVAGSTADNPPEANLER